MARVVRRLGILARETSASDCRRTLGSDGGWRAANIGPGEAGDALPSHGKGRRPQGRMLLKHGAEIDFEEVAHEIRQGP